MGKILPVIILLVCLSPVYSFAEEEYKCWEPADLLDKIRDADAVFAGKLVKLENINASYEELNTIRIKAVFSVNMAWKGIEANQKEVTVDTESFYKYDLQPGKEYLIYAFNIYGNDRLSIIGCPRVKEITHAQREFNLLGFPKIDYVSIEPVESSVQIRF